MAAGGFVTRAFESMLKECSGGKKYPALQKAIQAFIDSTKEINQSQHATPVETKQPAPSAGDSSETGGQADESQTAQTAQEVENDGGKVAPRDHVLIVLGNAGNVLHGDDAELVLSPLRLAFDTKNLKVLELALDCLHKLIAYDHLEGDPGLEDGKNAPLFTDILNMICGCIDNSSPDSTILQVLKVLLTAVASTRFRVHGEPLLGVIRVCCNIALNSKSPINQATSKAMLTQMISIVFRRMETDQDSLSTSSGTNESISAEISSTVDEKTTVNEENDKGTTLGDVLDSVKDTSIASVEELQNLAGGGDIKGLEAVLDKAVHIEDGKTMSRYIL